MNNFIINIAPKRDIITYYLSWIVLVLLFWVDYVLLKGSILFQLFILIAAISYIFNLMNKYSKDFKTKEEAIKYLTELKENNNE